MMPRPELFGIELYEPKVDGLIVDRVVSEGDAGYSTLTSVYRMVTGGSKGFFGEPLVLTVPKVTPWWRLAYSGRIVQFELFPYSLARTAPGAIELCGNVLYEVTHGDLHQWPTRWDTKKWTAFAQMVRG